MYLKCFEKNKILLGAGVVAPVVEHLFNMHGALGSIPRIPKKRKNKIFQEVNWTWSVTVKWCFFYICIYISDINC